MGLKSWDVDIDRWLNRFVPYNRLSRLPRPVSRFLGYRNGPHHEIGNVLVAWWAFAGAFSGVAAIEAVLMIPEIQKHGVPTVIASFVSSLAPHPGKPTHLALGCCSYSRV